MLKKIGDKEITEDGAVVRMGEAGFPAPFKSGLEYSSPARGTWNIVHTGMLIPEAHEIFVCAASCLRGVVLTAAEMNAMDRFSTVEVKENNLLDGNLEELLIDGVSDILNKLPQKPPASISVISTVMPLLEKLVPASIKRMLLITDASHVISVACAVSAIIAMAKSDKIFFIILKV